MKAKCFELIEWFTIARNALAVTTPEFGGGFIAPPVRIELIRKIKNLMAWRVSGCAILFVRGRIWKLIKFNRPFEETIPPMPADKTAMGTAPAAALQYCESMTTASSFGWYIFPPKEIRLRWDGRRTEVRTAQGWRKLETESLGPEYEHRWDKYAPDVFKGRLPNYLQRFFIPGIVQIWSGMFVSSEPDWSLLVRPIANCPGDGLSFPLEGVIETDIFSPCPLFVNIRLLKTDTEIVLDRLTPLFQVQPIHRSCYSEALRNAVTVGPDQATDIVPLGLTGQDWEGLEKTTRLFDPGGTMVEMGHYKKLVRQRRRKDGSTSGI